MKRRSFLAMSAAIAFTGSLATGSAAHAVTPDQARSLIENVSQQVIALIQAPGTPRSKAPQLRAIMEQYFALRDVAGFALGRYARATSPAQRDVYVNTYADYVARTYADKFSEYAGEQITVTNAQDVGSKGVYVTSTVNSKGQLINIGWQVQADRNGQPKITDINVDGLSMAESQRADFTRMIADMGGDVDAFIARLQTLGA